MTADLTRILVPTDFSQESRAAMTYGMLLAEKCGASLHLLHVLEVVTGPGPLTWHIESHKPIEQAIEAAAWDDLRGLLSAEEQTRVRAVLALEWGSPLEEIVRYARSRDIDLIAMGTHGRGGVKRLVIGSVAEHVVRDATCAVLTVHHSKPELVHP
jgi:nucleotide-binding universal stress UspA family protein